VLPARPDPDPASPLLMPITACECRFVSSERRSICC
jgi:hypothetical protein